MAPCDKRQGRQDSNLLVVFLGVLGGLAVAFQHLYGSETKIWIRWKPGVVKIFQIIAAMKPWRIQWTMTFICFYKTNAIILQILQIFPDKSE
ncbi:MAG: hypothetical protein C4557_03185 [Anaerolineaceae bacterium]|jgi:hypothetical protein|nr:MAG: hypothetical protein C4557_03185 [Anaerolineaceae bacterium]